MRVVDEEFSVGYLFRVLLDRLEANQDENIYSTSAYRKAYTRLFTAGCSLYGA